MNNIDIEKCIYHVRIRMQHDYSVEQIVNDLEPVYGHDMIFFAYQGAKILEEDRKNNFIPEAVPPVKTKNTVKMKRVRVG